MHILILFCFLSWQHVRDDEIFEQKPNDRIFIIIANGKSTVDDIAAEFDLPVIRLLQYNKGVQRYLIIRKGKQIRIPY